MNKNLINHIAFVLDASSSIEDSRLTSTLENVFDNEIEHLKQRSVELNQETRVSVYRFANKVKCLVFDMDVMRMFSIKGKLKPYGMTALIDAVTKAIKDMKVLPEIYGDHAFLVYVLTDGGENMSNYVNRDNFPNLMKSLKDNWTMACMVPNSKGVYEAKRSGFPANNVQVWETTKVGAEEAGRVNRLAMDNYMVLRSKGVRSTTTFYSTDLSNIKTTDIKKALTELKPIEYKMFRVGNKDRVIKDFIESWTKEPYRIGSSYYELMKTEEIQGGKEICIQHRTDGRVYHGHNARNMLGLPQYTLKVKPGDHGDWRLFVQSTSVNRKLPPHTQVLVIQ